jgi:predicted metal-dependent phosphoesterase TrpH
VLEHAPRHTDLGVIAITDHDIIDGALEARALAEENGIEVVVGNEVSTAAGRMDWKRSRAGHRGR